MLEASGQEYRLLLFQIRVNACLSCKSYFEHFFLTGGSSDLCRSNNYLVLGGEFVLVQFLICFKGSDVVSAINEVERKDPGLLVK